MADPGFWSLGVKGQGLSPKFAQNRRFGPKGQVRYFAATVPMSRCAVGEGRTCLSCQGGIDLCWGGGWTKGLVKAETIGPIRLRAFFKRSEVKRGNRGG